MGDVYVVKRFIHLIIAKSITNYNLRLKRGEKKRQSPAA